MASAQTTPASGQTSSRDVVMWIAAGAVLILLTVGWFFLPVQNWLQAFNGWVAGFGAWGFVLFALLYIVGTVALAPGAAFTIAAGLAFGLWGFPLSVVAATIGATLAFLIARYVLHDKVKQLTEKHPKFVAADNAVSEEGWKVVALLRLSPVVPFNLQNYAFGVTDISLWQYVAATFFGIMPGALLYTYLGAAGKAAGGDQGASVPQYVLFGVGLLATITVTVYVTWKAKAKLQQGGLTDQSSKG